MAAPILVIMAAGLGSRYGGLKQMDPIGPNGQIILDYSLFDAYEAGFRRAVIVIKEEHEADFRERLKDVMTKMEIRFAHQKLEDLPEGFTLPEGRVKPWGTGHAVMSAGDLIDAPFCAINADDYYGKEAFRLCYRHLSVSPADDDFCMAGYYMRNTLSESGYVARGVCDVDENGTLREIVERTHIISTVDGPLYTEDLVHYTKLSPDTVVSMNMWAFPQIMMKYLRERFERFLRETLPVNPLKGEYFLPFVVNDVRRDGLAKVRVMSTPDKWYGVTYRQDRPLVTEALTRMTAEGLYPEKLW